MYMSRCLMFVFMLAPASGFGACEAACFAREISQDQRAAFDGYGQGLAAAASAGGKPRLVRTEPNLHDSESMDRIEAVAWGGVSLLVRRVQSKPESPLFEQLKIDRKGILLPHGFIIGTSKALDVERTLGKPHQKSGSIYRYIGISQSCDDIFSFHFRKDLLSAVDWEWCHD
jgi:hypothetical protein